MKKQNNNSITFDLKKFDKPNTTLINFLKEQNNK